ncbi:hypothetical protein CPB86DRAFT_180807 [Serendipita vermifera]|nr:hypothetical protein CPB86DRAFT_180807 [Serendipita vermifera]
MQTHPIKFQNRDILLVDTPGMTGDNISDRKLLGDLRKWLNNREFQGDRLIGIIYLHDVSEPRYTGSAKRPFDRFHELCGAPANVAIVTTHWHDAGTQYYGKQQEIHNMFQEGPWRRWIKRGEELHQTDDTLESTKKIMRSVLQNEARVQGVRLRVDEARRRAPRGPKNRRDEWRVVRAARDDLEDDVKKSAGNSTDLEGQLRILRAWEEYVRPSLGSRLLGFFG